MSLEFRLIGLQGFRIGGFTLALWGVTLMGSEFRGRVLLCSAVGQGSARCGLGM